MAMNIKKVSKFNEIVKALQSPAIIYDESVQGFRIIASKGPFRQASEMQEAIKRQAAYSEALFFMAIRIHIFKL